MSADPVPFWRSKTLAEMSATEWESLCDGCGRCCLVKLEEECPSPSSEGGSPVRGEDGGRVFFTDVGCRLLDERTCGCRDYANRSAAVPDCVRLTPAVVEEIGWLPPTCAYRLVAEGRDLYWWHPLVSGDRDTVHMAGVSVRGRVAASETEVAADDLEDHIVSWPLRVPKGARRKPLATPCGPAPATLRPAGAAATVGKKPAP